MKLALRSNVAGRIKKIREGAVYQDKFCFVSELIQNSQRAKAKNINIQTRYSGAGNGGIEVVFQDDGKGCNDPAKVFTLDLSGWEGVHQPFGEGFSSIYQVADEVVVQSKSWTAMLNIKQALENEDFEDAISVSESEKIKGFKVTATLALDALLDLENEIKIIGSRVPVDVVLNDCLIEKEQVELEPFTVEKNIRGMGRFVLAPSLNNANVRLFYEGRFVTEQHIIGLDGMVFLKAGALTLKAPDRRAVIDDEKSRHFKNTVLDKLKTEVYKKLVKDYPELIQQFSYEIGKILNPKDFMKHISFGLKRLTPKNSKQESSNRVSVAASTLSIAEGVAISAPAVSNEVVSVPVVAMDTTEEIKEIKRLVKKGKIFYYRDYDSSAPEQASLLRYYGATVIMADELQEQVLEYLNVPEVHEAQKYIRKSVKYTRVGAITKKEERILSFLTPIIKKFDLPSNIFKFADITSEVVFTNKEGNIIGKKKSCVLGTLNKEGYAAVILLSRKELGLRKFPVSYGSENLTLKDIKLLIQIIPVIAHELAHLIYNEVDNTLEIYKRQEALESDIRNILF